MRSTMTLYRAASPIRVPPSFTNSAVTPSFAPSVLTRSINAGRKLDSRPQSRPTVFTFVLLSGSVELRRSRSPSIHCVRRRSPRLSNSSARFIHQVAHDSLQVSRFLIYPQFPSRPRPPFHNLFNLSTPLPPTYLT